MGGRIHYVGNQWRLGAEPSPCGRGRSGSHLPDAIVTGISLLRTEPPVDGGALTRVLPFYPVPFLAQTPRLVMVQMY
jgi:hypothetical protein